MSFVSVWHILKVFLFIYHFLAPSAIVIWSVKETFFEKCRRPRARKAA